ncbi:MAG: SocA family protein [Deltaproteobacteria bacterium]|nr:SocA family protein [Deltaproteobacteria bacterium]
MSVDTKKLANLILYLAGHSKISDLGLTKLYKLVFFSDVTHLRSHGSSITGSEYIKYPFGPVPSRGEKVLKKLAKDEAVEVKSTSLNEARDLRRFNVRQLKKPDMTCFSSEELATIDSVVVRLGQMSAKDLSELSHAEPAWTYAEMMQKLDPELMMYGTEEDPKGL